MIFLVLLLISACQATSPCSNTGLWRVNQGDTMEDACRALGIDIRELTQCDEALKQLYNSRNFDGLQAFTTYTVPYLTASAAPWETDGQTHILDLDRLQDGSGQRTHGRSTLVQTTPHKEISVTAGSSNPASSLGSTRDEESGMSKGAHVNPTSPAATSVRSIPRSDSVFTSARTRWTSIASNCRSGSVHPTTRASTPAAHLSCRTKYSPLTVNQTQALFARKFHATFGDYALDSTSDPITALYSGNQGQYYLYSAGRVPGCRPQETFRVKEICTVSVLISAYRNCTENGGAGGEWSDGCGFCLYQPIKPQ